MDIYIYRLSAHTPGAQSLLIFLFASLFLPSLNPFPVSFSSFTLSNISHSLSMSHHPLSLCLLSLSLRIYSPFLCLSLLPHCARYTNSAMFIRLFIVRPPGSESIEFSPLCPLSCLPGCCSFAAFSSLSLTFSLSPSISLFLAVSRVWSSREAPRGPATLAVPRISPADLGLPAPAPTFSFSCSPYLLVVDISAHLLPSLYSPWAISCLVFYFDKLLLLKKFKPQEHFFLDLVSSVETVIISAVPWWKCFWTLET